MAQPPATPVEVAVEVRGCARRLPRPLTVSLALAGAPADAQVLTGDNVVTLRATGALAADGVVALDLTFSDVFLAADVAEAGNGLPPPLRAQLFYLYEFTASVDHLRANSDTLPELADA